MAKNKFQYDYSGGDPEKIQQYAQQVLQNALASSGLMNTISSADAAYANNQAPSYNFSDYSAFSTKFAKDWWHSMYNTLQESEIDQSNDIIMQSKMDEEDASFVLHYYHPNSISDEDFYNRYGIDRENAGDIASQKLERLRKDGVWTENRLPSVDELSEIMAWSNINAEKARKNRQIDEEQLKNSQNNYDISQYFTKKSNESATSFGNFLYKSASLFGGSWSDIGHQLLSQAAGLTAAIGAEMAIGATAGSAAGSVVPGAGTAAGGGVGALYGAAKGFLTYTLPRVIAKGSAAIAASQVAGGQLAREGESRIEAFGAYMDNLNRIVKEDDIDTNKVIANVRKQLANNGMDPNVSDEEALTMAALGDVESGSNQFDDAARRAYRGTRRLFERNMALGAGEIATDLLFYVPAFRNSSIVRSVLNPSEGVAQLTKKGVYNPIKSLLNKRSAANAKLALEALDVAGETTAKTAKKLTGDELSKRLWKKELTSWGAAKAADMYEEATEEGAQYIASKEAMAGEYDNEQAHTNFIDALTSGQLFEDIGSNWVNRQRSTLAVLPFSLDPVYSNDSELFENYISGGLLSALDPRALTIGGKELLWDVRKQAKNSKQFGDIFQRALEEQDFVDRSVDLLQSVRDLNAGNRAYGEVLDNISQMLKSGEYDLGTITDPESGKPTDEQIDDFINEEKEAFDRLMQSKAIFAPIAQKMGMSNRDLDIYVAIANNTDLKTEEQYNKTKESEKEANAAINAELAENTLFSDSLYKVIQDALDKQGLTVTDSEMEQLHKIMGAIASVNNQLESAIQASQRLSNAAYGQALIKERGLTSISSAALLQDLQNAANEVVKNITNKRLQLIDSFASAIGAIEISNSLKEKKNVESKSLEALQNTYAALIKDFQDSNFTTELELNQYESNKEKLEQKINQSKERIANYEQSIERHNSKIQSVIDEIQYQNGVSSNFKQSVDAYINDSIKLQSLKKKQLEFLKGDDITKDLVQKYKERVKSLAQERDTANQVARGENTDTVEQAKVKTDEQLEQSLNEAVDNIMNSLQQAVAVSPKLQQLVDRLQRGLSTIKSASNKVSYVKRSIDKFSKQLEKLSKDDFKEEDSKTFNDLKTIVANASSIVEEINKRAYDVAYNAKRRKLDLVSDTNQWTASDGKKYVFLNRGAQFSIDEGAILTAIDVTDSSEIDDLKKRIKEEKKEKAKAVAMLKNVGDDNVAKERITNQIISHDNHISNLTRDLENKQASQVKEFVVSRDREYLASMKRKNNDGKEISFENKLEKIENIAKTKIDDAIEKRDKASLESVTIEEVPDSTEGSQKITPEWLEKSEVESQKKKGRLIPYAYAYTGNALGMGAANRFKNSYYEASAWRGYYTVQKWEDVKDLPFANKKVTEGPVKWDRPAAYHTYEKLLKLTNGKTPQQILGIFNKAKKGQIEGITAKQYKNMILALPINSTYFNNRVVNSNGTLIPTRLVLPDGTSLNRIAEMTDQEMLLRERMIMNLANNQKEDGSAPVVNGKDGSIKIFQKGFSQRTIDEANPTDERLLDERGEMLSASKINEVYDNHVQNSGAIDTIKSNIKDLKELLTLLKYDNVDNLDGDINVNDTTTSALSYFLRGISEYGDGIIKSDTFIKNYLKPILGNVKERIENTTNEKIAQTILDYVMGTSPQVFMQYLEDGGVSLNTEAQVELALQNRWAIRLNIKYDGKAIQLNNRTKDMIVELCEQIEDDIKNLNNREQFIESLKERGFQFGDKTAIKLGDYFINRKFNKLLEPSNIINVLTSNDSVPVGNQLISRRKKRVQNSKISDVKSLGIVFDESTGMYYHSKDKYKEHVRKLTEKEELDNTEEDIRSAEELNIIEGAENALRVLNGKGSLKEKVNKVLGGYNTTYEEALNTYNENLDDTRSPIKAKQPRKSVVEWFINFKKELQLNELYKRYIEEESEGIDTEVDAIFEGKDNEPVVFGYASANGTVMRYDTYDKKVVPMQRTNVKPGTIVMVLPTFLNPNRDHIIILLNPSKIDINIARVIAKLMHGVATGKFSEDLMITTGMVDGLEVTDQITIGNFIDQFMFTGTDAISRDPSNENLDRLVYIDNNAVYFGNTLDGKGTEVTDENIEEFAQWISTVKNYRVDSDMLSSVYNTVKGSFEIKDENGNTIYKQEEGDNYIANLINQGKLMTDLDTSADSTLFEGSPRVYMDFYDAFEGISEDNDKPASNSKNKNSAESLRKEISRKVSSTDLAKVDFIKDVVSSIESNLKSDNPDEVYVTVNNKRIEVDFTDDGQVLKQTKISGPVSELLAANKPVSIEIEFDGRVVSTLSFGKKEEVKTELKAETELKNKSVKTEPKITPKKESTEIEPLVISDDIEEYEDVKKIVKEYYNNNKNVLPKDFVDTVLDRWNDGENDFSDLLPNKDTATEKNTSTSIPKGTPELGLSDATVTPKKQGPTFNLQGVASTKTEAENKLVSTTKTGAKTEKPTRTVKQMVENMDVDTIEYLILTSNSYKQDSPVEDRIKALKNQYVSTLKEVYGTDIAKISEMFKNTASIGDLLKKRDLSKGKEEASLKSSISKFFKLFVRMEDYNKAIERAKKILGRDFNFETYSELPLKYDKNSHTAVYIYGACTANGIRLFRDAKKNKIRRGVAYHEAFHRVSMLLMTKAQRELMYQALSKYRPQLANASERTKQEFLADMFAKYVLSEVAQANPLFKYMNKLYKSIKELIDRLRNRVDKIDGRQKINQLFRDMYSGKYAYAKASKDNIEYFNLTFGYDPLYSAYKYNGVEIAESAQQFNDIYRNILAKIIDVSGINSSENGLISIDYKTIKKYWEDELETAKQVAISALGVDDESFYAALKYQNVVQGIVDNWSSWQKYLKQQIRMKFALDSVSDPNDIDFSDYSKDIDGVTTENEQQSLNDMFKTIQNDQSIVASYMRNQYKALDADIRLLFYTVTADEKLTEDGLHKYVNVFQLWHELCMGCQQAKNVDDMLNIINKMDLQQKARKEPRTMRQVSEILNNPNTSEQIKAKLFGAVVKYVNDFVFINYRKLDNGKLETSIEDSNMEKRMKTSKNQWIQTIIDSVNGISSTLQGLDTGTKEGKKEKENKIKEWVKENKFDVINLTAENLTTALTNFGLPVSEEDVRKVLSKLDRKQLIKYHTTYNQFITDVKNSLKRDEVKSDSQNYEKIIREQFNPEKDTLLNLIMEQTASQGLGSAKNDTVRIAGGAVAYIIGQYNYVTRFFRRLLPGNDSLLNRFLNNPYTKPFMDGKKERYYGSKWLKAMNKKIYPILQTVVGTVSDSNYNESNDFMGISAIEDMLNKFVTSMSGKHVIPELANKKVQYLIDNIPMEQAPLELIGSTLSITQSALDTFRGYMLAEAAAIKQANITRNNFIKLVNKVLGTRYTYKTLSSLSQEKQEEILKDPRIAPALSTLRLNYHYSKSGGSPIKNEDGSFTTRSFGINLTKGNGYKSRHFSELWGDFNIDENTSETEIIQFVRSGEVDKRIKEMILWNIHQVLDFMNNKKIISGYDADKSIAEQVITNNTLPENKILENVDLFSSQKKDKALTSKDLIKAISYFVMNNMCDVIEFEKIISGDIAEYKNMDAVNKRYSALTSTVQMKNDLGTIKNEFVDDRLYNSDTYRTVEINTTKIDNIAKFKYEAKVFLGEDAFNDELNTGDTLSGKVKYNCLDYRKLLDANGKFTKKAKTGVLVMQYEEHRDKLRSYGVDSKGNPVSDEELAKRIVNNCYERLIGYRGIDPTDAQSWITAEMYRALLQRYGEWSTMDEACYNLLEHYDELDMLQRVNPNAYNEMLIMLGIPSDEIDAKFKAFKDGSLSNDEYKGYIIGKSRRLIAGSLKYVFFGMTNGDTKEEIFHLYDKTSLSPIFKIFADGHDMQKIYLIMVDTKTDMLKMESCTKTGNIPSFEIYDKDGNIDEEALRNSPRQSQLFEHLGKQLNTDPHKHTTATLLTQFMKVAVMNIVPTRKYNINGKTLTGKQLLEKYQQILDILTQVGYEEFCSKYGIDPETFEVDNDKFAAKLLDMASTQGATSEMLDALATENGDFIIHPSGLPNINWVQSRLISDMDKTVIKTVTPGKPLFQVSSVGYDNVLRTKVSADSTLRSYDSDGYMLVKLSISLFDDVLKEAGLENASFDEQRRFLLENQEVLFALSYRVPTQGQNSTIPVKIVDVFEPTRGDIIMFPSDITALTGSDFDIDKMFLARYNVEIKDGKARKIEYDMNNINKDVDNKALQNALLDIYFTILTSKDHRVDAATPLDVTIGPLKEIKDAIEDKKGTSKDSRVNKSGWFLNPLFQVEQRLKNAGSSNGIGPMALNNVFRFFIQMSGLNMAANKYLNGLGLSLMDGKEPRIYDRNGENILDSTSALINAHVDAVKDNYIGRMNVNEYTFDVTSALISNGMGNDTYWFLGQQILVDLATNYMDLKNGLVGIDETRTVGQKFLYEIRDAYIEKINDKSSVDYTSKATAEEMSTEYLMNNITPKNSDEWYAQQLRYLNTFLYVKKLAEDYRKALTNAQIDTGKYGISANDIIKFMQAHEQFLSVYNTTFENPEVLFDKTFLGKKYDSGVSALFNIFSNVLLEFSPGYVNTINRMSKDHGIYGAYGKQQVKRLGQRLKTAILGEFFKAYLVNMYPNTDTPLKEFIAGGNTVVDRFNAMKERASYTNEGRALFDMLRPARTATGAPKFFNVSNQVNDDADVKLNISQAWQELYESSDEVLSEYAKELAVYMFFITGGTDANASGLTKTSIYDLVPPRLLASLKVDDMSYNKYVTNLMNQLSKPDSYVSDDIVKVAEEMAAIFDDKFATILRPKIHSYLSVLDSKGDAIVVRKGSDKLRDYNTGLFKKYVKIRNVDGTFTTYRLGDLQTSEYKGKSYINPVYYRIANIGYRNQKFQAYSVRADGWVDSNGNVKSLLYTNPDRMSSTDDIDLSVKENKKFKMFVDSAIPVTGRVDYSQIYDKLKGKYQYDGFNTPYGSFAAIDAADVVIYVNDGNAEVDNLKRYAEFKDKEFRVFNKDTKRLDYPGKKINIIGETNPEMLKLLISKLPKSVTYVTSSESNKVGEMIRDMITRGELTGVVYDNDTSTTAIDSTDSNNFDNILEGSVGSNDAAAYRYRTNKNAEWSDVTIAFALDFKTAGEQLTKSVAGNKYQEVQLQVDSTNNGNLTLDYDALDSIVEKYKDKKELKVNIAGNGIYTFAKSKINQNKVDTLIENAVSYLREKGLDIAEIRSGGQTGVDEAGVKAADKLGIKWSILAPKGFIFRNEKNVTVRGKDAFMERFKDLNYKGMKPDAVQLNLFDTLELAENGKKRQKECK